MSSEVIQAVKTLTNDMHVQRSLAERELTGKTILQTCKHISFALVGLLTSCAITIAFQAIRVVAVVSITLLQSIMKLTKAAPRKRMQCSILYYLVKSVYHVDCTLGQVNGSTYLLIMLCDALTLNSSTDPAVHKVQPYMSVTGATCITGSMIGILIYTSCPSMKISWYCMRHGTPKAYSHADLVIQSALMENTGQESDITKESLSSANTQNLEVGCIKAESV